MMRIIFPHKLLLTSTQVSKLRKAFANGFSPNIKLSKTQLHKIRQSEEVSGRLLRPLLKTGLPLTENVLKLIAKSVLIPLRLTASASATDAAIHQKMFGSGTRPLDLAKWTTLIISNEKMTYIMKIVRCLQRSGLLIKDVSEIIQNKAKNKKVDFLECY